MVKKDGVDSSESRNISKSRKNKIVKILTKLKY